MFCGLLAAEAGCSKQRTDQRWVDEVTIEGAKTLDADDIEEGLATRETPWYWWVPYLGERSWFEAARLDADVQRVKAYFARRGFFRARVVRREVTEGDEGESVSVWLRVDEGRPTAIREVTVEGLDDIPADLRAELTGDMALKEAARYRSSDFRADRLRIRGALRRRGHAYAAVEGRAEVDRDLREARVTLNVKPGPRVRFGAARFEGNGEIPADKLRSLVSWEAGDFYDEDEVTHTRARLFKERLFAAVRVTIPEEPAPRVPVTIHVTPTLTRELRLGVGLAVERDRQELGLSARWTWRNFLGGMRTLRVRVEPAVVALPSVWDSDRIGPALRSDVKLTQPDILATGILAYGQLGYDLGIHEGYQYHGPRVALGLERYFWRDRIQVGLSWNFWFLDFFEIDKDAFDAADTDLGLGFVDPYRLAYLEEVLRLDLRDSMVDPRLGVLAQVSTEQGFPHAGGQFTYVKVVPEARGYVPLGTRRLVLAGRVTYGQMWSFGDEDTPVTRRLYLGGPTSHRGFSYDRLAPRGEAASGRSVPVGGTRSVLFSADLRFDVLTIADNWLGVSAFFDAGDVVPPDTSIDLGLLHLAVGGSLRYQTPIGAIRLGIGVRLNRLSERSDGRQNPDPGQRLAFHLTLGEAF